MMSDAEDTSILGSNLTAVEAISAKLAEVTRLAEKLDARLCEAGARTRPISIPTAVTSSASSLLSISAISPSGTPIRATSIATAPASAATVSIASSISQIRPAETTVVAKSLTPMAEKSDEGLLHISSSHFVENVEASNKDSNTKELTPRSESTAEEYNVECYTTATECSITPPPCSRSESFVTSPECEDLSTTAPVTNLDSTWATEMSKVTTTEIPSTIAEPLSAPNNENQVLKFTEATPNVCTTSEMKPTTQIETMDKITDERSGKIVKEVTETTVLRVSHDIRLGVASYKLTSNIVQDHRQHIDAKNLQNVERVLPAESHEKTDDVHRDLDLSQYKESEKYIGKCPKKIQSDQCMTTKLTKIRDHTLNESSRSNLREYEDASLQDLSRYHEDSGIDMSPMKKEDNLEGEDFLERARKL